jgi:hypothetical protein
MAFVLAPAVFPLVAWVISMFHYSESPTLSFAAFLIAASFTYPTALVLGLPLFLIFQRRRWQRWWQYSLGGATIAALPGFAIAWSIWSSENLVEVLLVVLRFAGIGAVSAFVFWLVLFLHLSQRHAA